MMRRITALSLLLSFALAVAIGQSQDRAPQDQSWNRRVAGAGDYQVVLEVSGRVEITRVAIRTAYQAERGFEGWKD